MTQSGLSDLGNWSPISVLEELYGCRAVGTKAHAEAGSRSTQTPQTPRQRALGRIVDHQLWFRDHFSNWCKGHTYRRATVSWRRQSNGCLLGISVRHDSCFLGCTDLLSGTGYLGSACIFLCDISSNIRLVEHRKGRWIILPKDHEAISGCFWPEPAAGLVIHSAAGIDPKQPVLLPQINITKSS
jgi:hypothetical protein